MASLSPEAPASGAGDAVFAARMADQMAEPSQLFSQKMWLNKIVEKEKIMLDKTETKWYHNKAVGQTAICTL